MKKYQIITILDGVFSEFDHWDCPEECGHKVALIEWRDDIANQIIKLCNEVESKL